MKRHATSYAVLGGFVLLMLGALLGSLILIGGQRGPTDGYFIELRNVAGVERGTPVSYEGYPIGEVASVTPSQAGAQTRFRIELRLRQGWRVPADSVARVLADGLLSAVSIDISEGRSGEVLAPGSRITGLPGSNLFAAMNAAASEFRNLSRDSVRPLVERLHGSAEVLEKSAPALLTAMNEVGAGVGENLPGILRQLRALSTQLNEQVPAILEDLRVVSSGMRASTPAVTAALDKGARRVDAVLSKANVATVGRLLGNLERVSGELGDMLARLDTTAGAVHALIADVDALVDRGSPQVSESLESLRASLLRMNDAVDTVSYHLEGGSRNMHEFSRRVRDNPSALLLSNAPEEGTRQ